MAATAVRSVSRELSAHRIARALEELTEGRPVVMLGSTGLAADGNLVFPAELATTATLAFAIEHTSGFVCVALPARECDRLRLPSMYPTHEAAAGVSYTVTVDAIAGITTGISARDRARTIRLLGSAQSVAGDFARPGHVAPCSVPNTGPPRRRSCAEAGVAIVSAAGLRPAAAFCALVSDKDPRRMAGRAELREFAVRHSLAMTSVDDVADYLEDLGPASSASAQTGRNSSLPEDNGRRVS